MNPLPVGDGQPCASTPHWRPGRSSPTGHSPTTRTRPIWSGSPGCRRSSPPQPWSSAKLPRDGEIDGGVIDRLSPTLENAQLAWSRSARRWAELTTPASRTDPALVEATGQLRAAIRAAVANQTGWATPDEIAGRIDL